MAKKKYHWLSIVLLSVLLIGLPLGSYLYLYFGNQYYKQAMSELKDHGKLKDFSFTTQDGETLTLEDVKGKFIVSNFMFTRCGGPCPTMASFLGEVQSAFSESPEVVILSHTVDPEYDQPSVLKKYADRVGATPNKWYFLTGTKPSLYNTARETYKIVADEGDGGPDDFIHSNKLVLIDDKMTIVSYYDGTSQKSVGRLIEHLALIIRKPSKKKVVFKKEKEI